MTSFPIANYHHGGDLHARAMDEATKPQCSTEYGVARLDETADNISHLNDVAAQDTICVAQPGSCARLSHMGHSSIFMCNKLDHPIQTMCVDLINAATEVSKACRFGSHYTYGYMANSTSGPDSYPYLVAIGEDYAFGTH
ncbi:hypothetical protein BDV59DRAFT_120668 [Aspergillus ambiguus]|uniref:uncharacterized protein n=1 Tax=Aspergillus ambiguus TaxID=176160 RepID=UPI003CCE2D4C